jgi:subtilisin-like proprotein convertase family protein
MKGALKLLSAIVLFGAICGCQGNPEQFTNEISSVDSSFVIYGEDDRRELYQIHDQNLKKLADSTVALFKPERFIESADGKHFEIVAPTIQYRYGLCDEEPYKDQAAGAYCSGSLIAPNVVLTAGHCIDSEFRCENMFMAFTFANSKKDQNVKRIKTSEVYRCAEIIHAEQANHGPDFALIRLDRKVPNHKPLKVRAKGKVKTGDAITVIGHPVGIPLKIAGGATVRSVTEDGYFVTNLDTYGGNSGSPVFNSETGEIEGILVRGEQDFVFKSDECRVSYECANDECRGEDVTFIEEVRPYLKDMNSTNKTEEFVYTKGTAIPDGDSRGIVLTLDVPSAPKGRSVHIGVDIEHAWAGDLIVTIEAPSGESVNLSYLERGNGQDIKGVYGVNLIPHQSLDKLKDVDSAGTWKLHISDRQTNDEGILNSWKIIFTD